MVIDSLNPSTNSVNLLNTSIAFSPSKKTEGAKLFSQNSAILEGLKYTMMKGILNMKGMGKKKVVRPGKALWTVKSISDIEEIEDKFVNHKRMNYHFFSKELIYYTCEFCLLRCIFLHKFTN